MRCLFPRSLFVVPGMRLGGPSCTPCSLFLQEARQRIKNAVKGSVSPQSGSMNILVPQALTAACLAAAFKEMAKIFRKHAAACISVKKLIVLSASLKAYTTTGDFAEFGCAAWARCMVHECWLWRDPSSLIVVLPGNIRLLLTVLILVTLCVVTVGVLVFVVHATALWAAACIAMTDCSSRMACRV